MTELLPVPYFHVVLPCQLVLILGYTSAKIVYDTLFEATWGYTTRKQGGNTNGNDSRFAQGQQLILTCTALSRAESGQRGAMEKY
jgi:hypothetical protein